MDFLEFKKLYEAERPKWMSDRAFTLFMYRKVLDNTLYDILPFPFCRASENAYPADNISMSGSNNVGMTKKRPSVKSTLCSLVVEDSVSFVFDEAHFPRIQSSNPEVQQHLQDVVRESHLRLAMINVARDGSVGSAALNVKLINGRFYYESLLTEYCQPFFNKNNPYELVRLIEEVPLSGSELISKGYSHIDARALYLFRREWTETEEIIYFPYKINSDKRGGNKGRFVEWEKLSPTQDEIINKLIGEDKNKEEKRLIVDKERSVTHNLGFVPIVWTKNLPGNIHGFQGCAIDGACTFSKAIDTNIELDYQLSMCGKGLKYSANPLLTIKGDISDTTVEINKDAGGVLVLPDENAEADLLQINGQGFEAVIKFSELLREIVLENIHGNRSSSKKSNFQQSGKALQMFNHPLTLLSGLLRITYGDGMLKNVLTMILAMMEKNEVIINNQLIKPISYADQAINLMWAPWFDNSPQENNFQTATVISAKDAGLITQETAVNAVSEQFGVLNVEKELAQIKIEQAEFIQQTAPQVRETIQV